MQELRITVGKYSTIRAIKRPGPVPTGEERVLGVMGIKRKANIIVGPVTEREEIVRSIISQEVGQRCVEVAHPECHQHEVDQIIHIDQHRQVCVTHAIAVESLHLVILSTLVHEAWIDQISPHIKNVLPGIKITVGRLVGIATRAPSGFNRIVVGFISSKISLSVGSLGTFLRHVQPPVNTVNVYMVIATSGVRLSHIPLGVAGKHFAQESIPVWVILECPGIILRGPEVEVVKFIDSFIPENRESQF